MCMSCAHLFAAARNPFKTTDPAAAGARGGDDDDAHVEDDIEEECRRLKILQAFRVRNSCDLIALPSSAVSFSPSPFLSSYSSTNRSSSSGGNDSSSGSSSRTSPVNKNNCTSGCGTGKNQELGGGPAAPYETKHAKGGRGGHQNHVPYRLNHLTCTLTPTVVCSKLDYTRREHSSDVAPFVRDQEHVREDMLTRFIIPNTADTSIRCIDHHHLCMELRDGGAKEDGGGSVGGSLSITHQRMGSSSSARRGSAGTEASGRAGALLPRSSGVQLRR